MSGTMSRMQLLECTGLFQMLVPDGWDAATDEEGTYELTPPEGDAAVQISVFQREDCPLEEQEALELLGKFLETVRPSSAEGIPAQFLPTDDEQRVFAEFTSEDEAGNQTTWLTTIVLWRQAMLLCSYTGEPGLATIDDARQMFISINRHDEEQSDPNGE